MVYNLCTPPENGGHGYSFEEAMNMTIPAAAFLLSSRERVERACKAVNRNDHLKNRTPQEVRESHREYMRQLRLKYTGKETL